MLLRPLLAALVLCACNSRAQPADQGQPAVAVVVSDAPVAPPIDAPTKLLVARFESPAGPMRARTARLAFTVENRGTIAATIDRDMLGSAIFVLDVFDAAGAQRFTIPPSVPPRDYTPRTESLAPGGRARFELDLNVFSPELAPGTYTARLRAYAAIQSDVVTFTVTR